MKRKFLRRDAKRFLKFGKGRGKRAKWRRPTGRDNKMREKRKGYPSIVDVGYSKDKRTRGKVNEKTVVEIFNVKNLQDLKEGEIGIVGNVGKKKKIEIAKYAKEKNLELKNLNASTYLKKNIKNTEESKK